MTDTYKHWTQKQDNIWWSFGWTTLFCTGIAILLWVLELSRPFSLSMGISLCIGWSILSVHVFAGSRLEQHLGTTFTNAVATGLGLAIAYGLLSSYFWLSDTYIEGIDWTTTVPALFFGIVGTIIFTSMSRVHQMREDLSKAEVQRLATERALAEAQLKTLQAQIEPHFLFNTLTTAMGLIHTQPRVAEETLQQLTKLLRNSLSRTRTEQTTLSEELSLITAYLRIAKIRMGERLSFEVINDEVHDDFKLPPMIVQPLVENAITHGVEPSENGGSIHVETKRSETGVSIVVRDTGLGLTSNSKTAGTNTGLRNVRERLKQLYGANASLKLTPNEPTGVMAILSIPNTEHANQPEQDS